jgi:hypothetical protein
VFQKEYSCRTRADGCITGFNGSPLLGTKAKSLFSQAFLHAFIAV